MNFHQLSANSLMGKPIHFKDFLGKKVLIVNTASECGNTPQYAQLQELYDNYKGQKLEILAFPCNQFGAQEPGEASEIASFCERNYGVTFTIMEKIDVKGPNTHPVYKWLCAKTENGKEDVEVSWNFQKFLVNENGAWVKCLSPETSPFDEQIINWLEA